MTNSTIGVDGITSEFLFATPVFKQVWPDATELNAYLRELILSRERAGVNSTREYSNVGGWHSPVDLHESWDPDLRLILERSRELAVEATGRLLSSGEKARRRLRLSRAGRVLPAGRRNERCHTALARAVIIELSRNEGCGNGAMLCPKCRTEIASVGATLREFQFRPQTALRCLRQRQSLRISFLLPLWRTADRSGIPAARPRRQSVPWWRG